jgi:hypothetical protein
MNPQVGAVAPVFAFAPRRPISRRFPVRKHLSRIDEPTPADLSAIEAEMPLIEAELSLLDAEIALINAADHGGPSPLDWRRLRRAEARVTRVAVELAARPAARKAVA